MTLFRSETDYLQTEKQMSIEKLCVMRKPCRNGRSLVRNGSGLISVDGRNTEVSPLRAATTPMGALPPMQTPPNTGLGISNLQHRKSALRGSDSVLEDALNG